MAFAGIGDRRAVDPLIKALYDEDANVRMVADFSLREAFKIEYDPDTRRVKIIPEEKAVEIDALPPEERRKVKSQLQTIYEKIEEMEQTSSPVRDDKLNDALYEEQGIRRLEVTQRLAMLIKNGCVYTPKPGSYACLLHELV